MPIKWTKTHRKKLSAIRHPHKADPGGLVPGPDEAWSWIRGRWDEYGALGCVVTAEPEYDALLQAVLSDFDQGASPAIEDPERELMRLLVYGFSGLSPYQRLGETLRAFLALWVDGAGWAFVLRLAEFVAPFAWTGRYYSRSEIHVEPLEPNPHGHKRLFRLLDGGADLEGAFWLALRSKLFALSEEEYARATEVFAARRRALVAGETGREAREVSAERCYLDFAFSRDPVWATEDARLTVEGESRPDLGEPMLVLAGLTDAKLAEVFAGEVYLMPYAILGRGYDLIESLGEEAHAVLEALRPLGRLGSRDKKKLDSLKKLAASGRP